MDRLQFIDARSAAEAVSLLRKYGKRAQIYASGADVLYMRKDRIGGPAIVTPDVFIHLGAVPGLDRIETAPDGGLEIGPMVRLTQLIEAPAVIKNFPLLSQAAEKIASPQLRNTSTIAGNLCQKPRCWYFRNPDIVCLKKGGSSCWAVEGDNRYYHAIVEGGPCHIVHPSDLAPCLVTLGARLTLLGPRGQREVPIGEFFVIPAQSLLQENTLGTDELIIKVSIPGRYRSYAQVFEKATVRQADEFALVSVALAASFSGAVCADCRIAFGGVSPRPFAAKRAEEALQGVVVNDDIITAAVGAAFRDSKPMSMNAYKLDLAAGLLRRAFRKCYRPG